MKIVAFDLSLTGTGFASSLEDYGSFSADGLKGVERLKVLRGYLQQETGGGDLCPDPPADLVVFEGYSFGSRGSALFNIAEWGGVARMAVYDSGIPFAEISPGTLKKFATGKGNSPKADMRMALYKRAGIDVDDEDAVDALWLLAAAWEHYGDPLWPMPAGQCKALEVVEWPTFEGTTLAKARWFRDDGTKDDNGYNLDGN